MNQTISLESLYLPPSYRGLNPKSRLLETASLEFLDLYNLHFPEEDYEEYCKDTPKALNG